jgi:hypothetical protein
MDIGSGYMLVVASVSVSIWVFLILELVMVLGIGVGIVIGSGVCIGICVGIGAGAGSIRQHLAVSGILWWHTCSLVDQAAFSSPKCQRPTQVLYNKSIQ